MSPPTGPFDSLREYVAALEAHGRLLRIAEMDQDRFEATGFAYRMIEEMGDHAAPAFLIRSVRPKGAILDLLAILPEEPEEVLELAGRLPKWVALEIEEEVTGGGRGE